MSYALSAKWIRRANKRVAKNPVFLYNGDMKKNAKSSKVAGTLNLEFTEKAAVVFCLELLANSRQSGAKGATAKLLLKGNVKRGAGKSVSLVVGAATAKEDAIINFPRADCVRVAIEVLCSLNDKKGKGANCEIVVGESGNRSLFA